MKAGKLARSENRGLTRLVHFSRVGLDCRWAPALDHVVLGVRAYLNNFIFAVPALSHGCTLSKSYGARVFPKGHLGLSLIHISEPTRQAEISYAVFCLKKKKKTENE